MLDRSLSVLHRSEPTLLNVSGCIDLAEGDHASDIEDISAIIANLLEAIGDDIDGDILEHVGDDGEDSGDPPNKVIDNDDMDALTLRGVVTEDVAANFLANVLVAVELLVVAGGLVLVVAGVVERS